MIYETICTKTETLIRHARAYYHSNSGYCISFVTATGSSYLLPQVAEFILDTHKLTEMNVVGVCNIAKHVIYFGVNLPLFYYLHRETYGSAKETWQATRNKCAGNIWGLVTNISIGAILHYILKVSDWPKPLPFLTSFFTAGVISTYVMWRFDTSKKLLKHALDRPQAAQKESLEDLVNGSDTQA